jgi:hypothetical protein
MEEIKPEEVDDPSLEEDEDVGAPIRYTISSYGADYPVDGLVNRLKREDIYVPEFQRGFVWSHAQASRFVESLLLGLPIPGIFLFKEPDTQKLVVVDGQQRLSTLHMFYDGLIRKREFVLRGVTSELEGLAYKTLPDEDRRRLDDSILHATVFQQEDPSGDRSSVYLIFERLNTGGTPLAPQEIRSCVYHGSFDQLLKELAQKKEWQEIYGPPSPRGKDQELILRFFALHECANEYEQPMKKFLNDYMARYRNTGQARIEAFRAMFTETITFAARHLSRATFRPERNLNAAVLDAVLVGLAARLRAGPINDVVKLQETALSLLKDDDFIAAITSSTTNKTSVSTRIGKVTEAFAGVQ